MTPPEHLIGCARCFGPGHDNLEWHEFRNPVLADDGSVDCSHWATCPATGDPILFGTHALPEPEPQKSMLSVPEESMLYEPAEMDVHFLGDFRDPDWVDTVRAFFRSHYSPLLPEPQKLQLWQMSMLALCDPEALRPSRDYGWRYPPPTRLS